MKTLRTGAAGRGPEEHSDANPKPSREKVQRTAKGFRDSHKGQWSTNPRCLEAASKGELIVRLLATSPGSS
ncbi:hypothetical protein StoSoilB22_39340 [Arthrobacter sp. StoSoilB22]|nr:hypothetical protein StoSoilB22_39340 [Arthrobacter sp. StoSoilB22]